MRYLQILRIHFFITRELTQLNKKLKLKIHSSDVRLLYYLHIMGPMRFYGFARLNHKKNLKGSAIPKLVEAGFIEVKGTMYSATFAGGEYLRQYADMLNKSRLDRITLKAKGKRKTIKSTSAKP